MVLEVLESLTKNTVIMSTAPLASVLLEFRKGIPHENMVRQIEYIYGELKARNALTSESSISSRGTTNTMQLLEEFVRKKRDVFEPFVSPRVDYKNILMLSYYRNSLIYKFSKEMFIAVSLLGFGRDTIKDIGVSKERIWNKVEYLTNMLDKIFVQDSMKIYSYLEFEHTLLFMVSRKILYVENDMIKYETPANRSNGLLFLWNLIWPFIDTFWVTLVFIYTLYPTNKIDESQISSKIQWIAESLYEENIVLHYESWSQETINHAVQHFLEKEIIVKEETKTELGESNFILLHKKYVENEDLIQEEFDRLSFYKKLSLVKFSNLKIDIQKTMISNFFMMANI